MKDKKIEKLISSEEKRQRDTLILIPSENYTSSDVQNAVGSVVMNKYAEGQVGKRYYQGNEYIDQIEELCKERALKAFKLDKKKWGANVQAHSGSPANLAVYNALLKPGDKIMSMYLPDGGHMSHGWRIKDKKVTFVSKIWDITFYHVDRKTQVFDYDQIEVLAKKTKPKLIITGGTAYPREIRHDLMGKIAHSVGAYYLADIAHEAGLVVGGVSMSPCTYADVVTMTTHKTLRGPRGAIILARNKLIDDINRALFPGLQGGPHEHSIAGIAVALHEALKPDFVTYTKQIIRNAKTLAREFEKADIDVVSGGTDKHLVLLDLRSVNAFAWGAAWALEYAGIITNRNTVPYDTASPFYPSGLRMGTPAVTTRGMKEAEMKQIAKWTIEVITNLSGFKVSNNKEKRKKQLAELKKSLSQNKKYKKIAQKVRKLCSHFPLP